MNALLAMADPPSAECPLAGVSPGHPAQAIARLPVRLLVAQLQRAAARECTDQEYEAIYTAFYHRYHSDLLRLVSRALRFAYTRDEAREVTHDALLGFFLNCRNFVVQPDWDDTRCESALRSYLGKIAWCRAKGVVRFRAAMTGADHEKLDWFESARLLCAGSLTGPGEPLEEDPRLTAVSEWLDALTEKERDVVIGYFIEHAPGRLTSGRLPSGVARRLSEKYGVDPSTLRHLKQKLRRDFLRKFASS